MSDMTSREFVYVPPATANEYIDELLDDSISAGSGYKDRRQYVDGVLSAMYDSCGLAKNMAPYAVNYDLLTYVKSREVYDGLPLSSKLFDVGSKVAIHSLVSAIKDPELRQDLRAARQFRDWTEFGRLHGSLGELQFVMCFHDSLDQVVTDSPPSVKHALERMIDELYDDLPLEYQSAVAEDFLHGFHATSTAIKQYADEAMLDYRPSQTLDVHQLQGGPGVL